MGRRSFSASALVGCGCRAGCSRRCVCLFGGHGRLVRGFACLIDDGIGAVLRGLGWRGGVVGFVGGLGLVDWAAALFFARPAGPDFVFSLFDRGARFSRASSPSSTDWNRSRRSRSTLSSPPFPETSLFDVLPFVLVLRTDDVMNEGLAAAPLLFVAAAPFPPDARARARFEALSVSGSPGESASSPSRSRPRSAAPPRRRSPRTSPPPPSSDTSAA